MNFSMKRLRNILLLVFLVTCVGYAQAGAKN